LIQLNKCKSGIKLTHQLLVILNTIKCLTTATQSGKGRMPYAIRFTLFLFAALAVTGVLGYLSGFLARWAVVLVILVMILGGHPKAAIYGHLKTGH
jgi:hypothetical protein